MEHKYTYGKTGLSYVDELGRPTPTGCGVTPGKCLGTLSAEKIAWDSEEQADGEDYLLRPGSRFASISTLKDMFVTATT